MIDTPQNCFDRAATARSAAQGPMLENVRHKHLASAAAWESLAHILLGKTDRGHAPRPSKLPNRTEATGSGRRREPSALDGWENEGGSSRDFRRAGIA